MAVKKNIIANYVGLFYLIIINIVMVPFYLDYLGDEAYGLVGFFALIQSWMLLLDMGLSPTLVSEVSKVRAINEPHQKHQFKYLFHSIEFIFFTIAIIMMLIIYFSSHWISTSWLNVETLDPSIVAYAISLIGVTVALRFITVLYKSGIQGTEEQVWLNKANIMMSTLKFVGVLGVLHFISSDFQHFFEYQLLIAIIEVLVFAIKFYKIMSLGSIKIYFSFIAIKPIILFASSIAYSSGMWILITQLDKVILSSILSLREYGYYALIALILNAIMQLAAPINNATLPRMVKLFTQNKKDEVLALYKNSTQLVAILIFSVVGIIGVYSYEVVYAWTGNIEAALWTKDILFWYAMSNGILAIVSFQYYLQFAHGELTMHIIYNSVIAFILPYFIIWAIYTHSVIGIAITWFIFSLIVFLIWVPIIHHTYAKGIHKDWLLKDILPIFIATFIYLLCLNYIQIDFPEHRGVVLLMLISIGIGLLFVNTVASSIGREKLFKLFQKRSRSQMNNYPQRG